MNTPVSTKPAAAVPVPGMTITPDHFGTPEWVSLYRDFWSFLCRHLIGEPKHQATFERQTGHQVTALLTLSPIERMIDGVSGHTDALLARWCDWVTFHHWNTRPRPDDTWQAAPPDRAGTWEMASAETDFEPQRVEVFALDGALWVNCPDTGRNPLKHYHDGLIDLRWRPMAQP